ncbi:39S ribosomal protein L33, mitochondrial [Emydomyces testavorans]|uniref:Large ribosomal subunit protein uL30m n=1 Tax=Emydomyces testavorans TaxID=2070801 RepID=A0AAF0IKD7_9EURO|nr:39S ribosomal protein L33, mitochondrial [Emydomyces testavorans]
MTFFRITLLRSAIGLPRRTTGVLKALGLKKRMATVFHPVTQDVAGQIMKIKELVSVQEVDQPLTKEQVHWERKPDPGYYVEKKGAELCREKKELEKEEDEIDRARAGWGGLDELFKEVRRRGFPFWNCWLARYGLRRVLWYSGSSMNLTPTFDVLGAPYPALLFRALKD